MDLPTFADLDQRGIAAGLSRAVMAKKLAIPISTYYRWVDDSHRQQPPVERFLERLLEFSALVEEAEQLP